MPSETRECFQYSLNGNVDRCSPNSADRLGAEPIGSCDYEQEVTVKVMSRGFQSATMKSIDALRSPVFDFLKHMQLPFFPMADILLRWVQLRSTKNVKHLEREGVCQGVYENIDHLVEHVPKGYPRERKILQHKGLTIADIFMTLLTMIVVVAFGLLVFMWRDKHDIKYAQVYALLMTALGTSTQIFFEPFDQAIYLINIF